jgi:hypothetical protein
MGATQQELEEIGVELGLLEHTLATLVSAAKLDGTIDDEEQDAIDDLEQSIKTAKRKRDELQAELTGATGNSAKSYGGSASSANVPRDYTLARIVPGGGGYTYAQWPDGELAILQGPKGQKDLPVKRGTTAWNAITAEIGTYSGAGSSPVSATPTAASQPQGMPAEPCDEGKAAIEPEQDEQSLVVAIVEQQVALHEALLNASPEDAEAIIEELEIANLEMGEEAARLAREASDSATKVESDEELHDAASTPLQSDTPVYSDTEGYEAWDETEEWHDQEALRSRNERKINNRIEEIEARIDTLVDSHEIEELLRLQDELEAELNRPDHHAEVELLRPELFRPLSLGQDAWPVYENNKLVGWVKHPMMDSGFSNLDLLEYFDADGNRQGEGVLGLEEPDIDPYDLAMAVAGGTAILARQGGKVVVTRLASGTRGRLFASATKTGSSSLPAGTGVTDKFGNVRYSTLGTADDVALARHHESIHSFLSPKFKLFRELRADFATAGYQKSATLRYIEEALAESYAQMRVNGIKGLPTGIKFPIKEGYVSIQALAAEGAVGTIVVGGVTYYVFHDPE